MYNNEDNVCGIFFWNRANGDVIMQRKDPLENTVVGEVKIKADGKVYSPGAFHSPDGLVGNATSASKLKDAKSINGTDFDGSGHITTQKWGTARNLKIGDKTQSVNGSDNITWTLSEIGAAP